MMFPKMHQIVITKNPNYLQSVWLGFTVPLLNLPVIIWNMILMPVITGVVIVVQLVFTMPYYGLSGRCSAKDVTPDEALADIINKMDAE